jgi:hypothetical protein
MHTILRTASTIDSGRTPGSLRFPRHEQAQPGSANAMLLCKNRLFDKGAVTIPLVLRKLLQSRGGYGLILEEGAAYVVRF